MRFASLKTFILVLRNGYLKAKELLRPLNPRALHFHEAFLMSRGGGFCIKLSFKSTSLCVDGAKAGGSSKKEFQGILDVLKT